jgi:hypothetical protein
MGNVRVKLNHADFNALLNGPEVVGLLEEIAGRIVTNAERGNRFHKVGGPAFSAITRHYKSRAIVVVETENFDGILAEAYDRALSKAIA